MNLSARKREKLAAALKRNMTRRKEAATEAARSKTEAADTQTAEMPTTTETPR